MRAHYPGLLKKKAIQEIIMEKRGSAAKVLYEIKTTWEAKNTPGSGGGLPKNNTKLVTSTISKRPTERKNVSKLKDKDALSGVPVDPSFGEDDFFEKLLDEVNPENFNQLDMAVHQRPFHDFQREQERVAMDRERQDRAQKSASAASARAEDQSRFQQKKEFMKTWEAEGAKAHRANQLVKARREQVELAYELSLVEKEEVYKELALRTSKSEFAAGVDEFEKNLKRLGVDLRGGGGGSKEGSVAVSKHTNGLEHLRALEAKVQEENFTPAANKGQMSALRDRRETSKAAQKEKDRRQRKMLVDQSNAQKVIDQDQREQRLLQRMAIEGRKHRQDAGDRWAKRQQKRLMALKIQREAEVQRSKQAEAFRAMLVTQAVVLGDPAKVEAKARRQDEARRSLEVEKKRQGEDKAKRNWNMCRTMVSTLVNLALTAKDQLDAGYLGPKEWRGWKARFVDGDMFTGDGQDVVPTDEIRTFEHAYVHASTVWSLRKGAGPWGTAAEGQPEVVTARNDFERLRDTLWDLKLSRSHRAYMAEFTQQYMAEEKALVVDTASMASAASSFSRPLVVSLVDDAGGAGTPSASVSDALQERWGGVMQVLSLEDCISMAVVAAQCRAKATGDGSSSSGGGSSSSSSSSAGGEDRTLNEVDAERNRVETLLAEPGRLLAEQHVKLAEAIAMTAAAGTEVGEAAGTGRSVPTPTPVLAHEGPLPEAELAVLATCKDAALLSKVVALAITQTYSLHRAGKEGILLRGFPRNVEEADALEAALAAEQASIFEPDGNASATGEDGKPSPELAAYKRNVSAFYACGDTETWDATKTYFLAPVVDSLLLLSSPKTPTEAGPSGVGCEDCATPSEGGAEENKAAMVEEDGADEQTVGSMLKSRRDKKAEEFAAALEEVAKAMESGDAPKESAAPVPASGKGGKAKETGKNARRSSAVAQDTIASILVRGKAPASVPSQVAFIRLEPGGLPMSEDQQRMALVEQCHAQILFARALKRKVDVAQMLILKKAALKATLQPLIAQVGELSSTNPVDEGGSPGELQVEESPEVAELKKTLDEIERKVELLRSEVAQMRDSAGACAEAYLTEERRKMSRGALLQRLFGAGEVDVGTYVAFAWEDIL
jgi:hypothetical protein